MFPVAKFKLCVFPKGCKFFILIRLNSHDMAATVVDGDYEEQQQGHGGLIFGHVIKYFPKNRLPGPDF